MLGRVNTKHREKFHPNYEFLLTPIEGRDNHSYAVQKWVTNFEKTFYLHNTSNSIEQMYRLMRIYNKMCMSQREFDGFDDEAEDEEERILH